jgi:malate dehydrogenase
MLIAHSGFKGDYAAVRAFLLFCQYLLGDVDGVADEYRPRETQLVDAVERDHRAGELAELDHQPSGYAENQRAVSDPLPERARDCVALAHVQLGEISRKPGEIHDVGLGDGSGTRRTDAVDDEIFKVETQNCTFPLVCLDRHARLSYLENSMRKKVTVVGAGNVGANCALRIAGKELADVVLVDIVDGVPQGKGLDLLQSGPVEGYDVNITGANDYGPTANSDIVVITAGFPRKPGMSRDDLLVANYEVVKAATEQAVKHSPNCILILVTNPLDAMCWTAYQVSKFSKNRVIGMAGVLDTARFRTFIAQELDVSVENVTAVVLGGHGDTMVPIARLSNVSGIPLSELLDQGTIDRLVQRARDGGAEIVKYLKTGSAYYAPSAAAVEMVESILKDKKKVLPCAAYLEGEYGIQGLFVGVPVKLGAKGIEKVYQIQLNPEEQAALQKSAGAVQELVGVLKQKMG